jgi:uncharacterized membrane protein YdjX (TVP38/TMEM64 family)
MADAERERPERGGGAATPRAPAPRGLALRLAPLGLIGLGLALVYVFGLHRFLSLETLAAARDSLAQTVAANPLGAAAAYVGLYVAAVALSFPGASFFTVAGGLLFGCVLGGFLAVAAATMGATLIFLIARTSLGDLLAERAGPRMTRLGDGFRAEGFSYLLFLRLVPLFPFWIVNLAAALFGMRLLPYVAATAIGIVPGTFVLAYFGRGLDSALVREGPPFELLIGLALLGAMALIPPLIRLRRRAQERRSAS